MSDNSTGCIRTAIIGLGGMGEAHLLGLLGAQGRFAMEALCDINPSPLQALGSKYNVAKLHTDYRAVVDDPAVDAVVVLVPHNLHEEVCVAAARAGKHILVEKPIARTLEEADRIIAAAGRAGVTLMVAHNQRFDPHHRVLREMLDSGRLGRIFFLRADHHQHFNRKPGNWWRSREAVGGGCLIGSGVHRLDLLRWYGGEVEEVFAYQTDDPSRLEAEVAVAGVLKFRNGAIGELMCNWGVFASPNGEAISVFGREGSVFANRLGQVQAAFRLPAGSPVGERPKLGDVPVTASCESMHAHFGRCIQEKTEPLTGGAEGRRSLELVLAMNLSGRTGQPVKLPL